MNSENQQNQQRLYFLERSLKNFADNHRLYSMNDLERKCTDSCAAEFIEKVPGTIEEKKYLKEFYEAKTK